LAFVTACAIAMQGYLAWQRHAAQRELRWAKAVFDEGAELQAGGESILRRYCHSSEHLCEAECRMPLADRKAAMCAHLECIIFAQRRTDALAAIILGGDMSGEVRFAETFRQRAEQMAASLDPCTAATLAAVERPIDVDFVETPLEEALERIEARQGIKFVGAPQVIKLRADHGDITPSLTFSSTGRPVRQVLREIEYSCGLVVIVDGGVVTVTPYVGVPD
jgi:hypothetical protein